MVITCPSCSARYRLPASLEKGGTVTCPRCANRFTAVPPSRVKRPPAVSTPVVAMTEGEAQDDRTLPPGAMAMIQLWEDAQEPEEDTASPDPAELDAARREAAEEASSKGVFLRRDVVPPTEPTPPPAPPPIGARPRGPSKPTPPPAERSGARRQRPEHDPKQLAEQLVMDSMITSRAAVVPARAAGPGIGTWVVVAVLSWWPCAGGRARSSPTSSPSRAWPRRALPCPPPGPHPPSCQRPSPWRSPSRWWSPRSRNPRPRPPWSWRAPPRPASWKHRLHRQLRDRPPFDRRPRPRPPPGRSSPRPRRRPRRRPRNRGWRSGPRT